jgi:hypothetical protein
MNNEPVAWMDEYERICHATDKKMEEITNNIGSPRNYFSYNIPLYTHPANLTDEEILDVAKEMGWRGALGFLINFARAILRKAQEK